MHLNGTPTPGWRRAEDHAHPHLGANIAPSSLVPPLPPLFPPSTPHLFAFFAAVHVGASNHFCIRDQEHKHEAHTLESSGADYLPPRCFYLAGFQDVDLFLIHGVPVLLQKSLTLVLHLAGGKGRNPKGKVQPHRDKVLRPTAPLTVGTHLKNLRGRSGGNN